MNFAVFPNLIGAAFLLFLHVLEATYVYASEHDDHIVRFYTHGEGDFAKYDGEHFGGTGVTLMTCVMERLERPYSLNRASMARKERLIQQNAADIWFPTIDYGSESRTNRIASPIGTMPIYWYLPKSSNLDPSSQKFLKQAKVSAFPGSTPAFVLRDEGYNFVSGSDDENTVVLWLMQGRLDGFLSSQFEELLKPGALQIRQQHLKRVIYKEFEVGFEFSPVFYAAETSFFTAFVKELTACTE